MNSVAAQIDNEIGDFTAAAPQANPRVKNHENVAKVGSHGPTVDMIFAISETCRTAARFTL
jgi:hypothetical protein